MQYVEIFLKTLNFTEKKKKKSGEWGEICELLVGFKSLLK